MDEIQKVLIKQGRRDLAQKYYEKISKVSVSSKEFEIEQFLAKACDDAGLKLWAYGATFVIRDKKENALAALKHVDYRRY